MICDLPRQKETTFNSSTIDELGSWCLRIGAEGKWNQGERKYPLLPCEWLPPTAMSHWCNQWNIYQPILTRIVQFRIHQNRWIKIQKKHLYRVNLNLKRIGENSHPSVCCFLLLINTFLLVFENIFFPLEANPVQMASFVFLSSGFGEFESGSLGGEGKAFNIASKMPCCCKKRTQSNHKEFPAELWVTPKLVWEPIIKTCPVQYMSPYTSKLS